MINYTQRSIRKRHNRPDKNRHIICIEVLGASKNIFQELIKKLKHRKNSCNRLKHYRPVTIGCFGCSTLMDWFLFLRGRFGLF
jgi:hypothetical protein